MSAQINKEKIQKQIARMLEHIRAEEDPRVLNEYRAIFKKEVSLFKRSWVSAYLLMLSDRGALGKTDRADKSRARKGGDERPRPSGGGGSGSSGCFSSPGSSGGPGKSPRASLAEEESKRLFISTGRNRRVFPRELLGLISAKTHVSREDIGSIRILDNYSFIQVRDTVAEQIIEALDGSMFRGRPLTVNYAKPRLDDAAAGFAENAGAAEDTGAAESAAFAEDAESPADDPQTDYPEDGGDAELPDAANSEQAQDHSDEENI